jgi:hypothetical protein
MLPGIHTPVFYKATALYSVPTLSAIYGTSVLSSAQIPPVYDTKILPCAYTDCNLRPHVPLSVAKQWHVPSAHKACSL